MKRTDRHVLEEKLTPLILDIEEESDDKDNIHEADEDDNDHATIHWDIHDKLRSPMLDFPPSEPT